MSIKRSSMSASLLLCVLMIVAATVLSAVTAHALDYPKLQTRSLRLGTTLPGATTSYTFSWHYPSPTTIGSVRFLFCLDAYVNDPCSATPPGDFSGATLTSQTGPALGFTILSQTADEMIISRPITGVGTAQATYVFDNVVNPTGLPTSFFVQIYTYPTSDASGLPNHKSSVANATTSAININSVVPPILYFCAALTVTDWCESVGGNFIDYGNLSSTVGDAAISQFGVATNASGGYVVTINGNTMASGNKIIAALNAPAANTPGIPQFGINLRANTDPPNGIDESGVGVGTVAAAYDTPDMYQYVDGDIVAGAVTGTMFNTYTVTYIVNIPADQPSGVYNTTITYICTAAF